MLSGHEHLSAEDGRRTLETVRQCRQCGESGRSHAEVRATPGVGAPARGLVQCTSKQSRRARQSGRRCADKVIRRGADGAMIGGGEEGLPASWQLPTRCVGVQRSYGRSAPHAR